MSYGRNVERNTVVKTLQPYGFQIFVLNPSPKPVSKPVKTGASMMSAYRSL